jgi:hypothetical protein
MPVSARTITAERLLLDEARWAVVEARESGILDVKKCERSRFLATDRAYER